jgi:dsRNA-specific ribonuclease
MIHATPSNSALLLQSTHPRGLLYRHPLALNGDLAALPAAIVSREHAARLARLLKSGPVRMQLSLVNKVGGPYESQNVTKGLLKEQ